MWENFTPSVPDDRSIWDKNDSAMSFFDDLDPNRIPQDDEVDYDMNDGDGAGAGRIYDSPPQWLPDYSDAIESGGENAGAWTSCDIETMFNDTRRANQQDEIHDPDCNPDDAEKILDDLNS